ncbi:transporter substrate-binding domain-containing protein [Rhodococcus gannanensis]|uniref:Transporter substrate-binding domain-containing protein n=1 Tax=Rhodococcus gannanensis TaxID=1960308 RepID=A0ABW4NY97_9NOCA
MVLSGCSTPDAASDTATTPSATPSAYTKLPSTASVGNCGPDSGLTHSPGTLTIATDSPAYAPWFVDDDPSNGKGFEGSVARTVAERLGYTQDQITFVRVPWAEAIAPGPKDFDFDINQVTIVGDRREAVDFSSPYYAVTQAIVAMEGSPAAASRNLNDLTGFRLGAQIESTSLAAIEGTIRPRQDAVAFETNDDAKVALAEGRIDALVVDIPTGLQITESDLPKSVLVGQFPRPNTVTEFFGLVLEKNSPLTSCTTAAVDALYQDGTLDNLAQTWLIDSINTPILE